MWGCFWKTRIRNPIIHDNNLSKSWENFTTLKRNKKPTGKLKGKMLNHTIQYNKSIASAQHSMCPRGTRVHKARIQHIAQKQTHKLLHE